MREVIIVFYFPRLTSSFQEDEAKKEVVNKLKNIKEDVDNLVFWHRKYIDECNFESLLFGKQEEYDKDYLELQRLINKFIRK